MCLLVATPSERCSTFTLDIYYFTEFTFTNHCTVLTRTPFDILIKINEGTSKELLVFVKIIVAKKLLEDPFWHNIFTFLIWALCIDYFWAT